jgi:hypothetical protein
MTYINMPNTLVNIVRARSVTELVCFTTDILVPFGHLEAPYSPREEACTNEVQETGGENKEELEFGTRATPITIVSIGRAMCLQGEVLLVQEVTDTAAGEETDNSR